MYGGIKNLKYNMGTMKKYIILLAAAFAIFAASCEEESANVSKETVFASFEMQGDRYMSLVKGGTYTEPGVTAKEGETDLEVTINGEVDVNVPGVYDIMYSAVNKDGFPGSVTRTIAVLPTPEQAGVDISGKYDYATGGFTSEITKLAPGFYLTNNLFSPGSPMAAYLITTNGTDITVPLSSLSVYGPLKGTATLSSSGALNYTVDIINYGIKGSVRRWQKK